VSLWVKYNDALNDSVPSKQPTLLGQIPKPTPHRVLCHSKFCTREEKKGKQTKKYPSMIRDLVKSIMHRLTKKWIKWKECKEMDKILFVWLHSHSNGKRIV
jgi:hypothetical protein